MKYYYIACTIKRQKGENGVGYYSYVERFAENENVVTVLNRIDGLIYSHIFSSLKKAKKKLRKSGIIVIKITALI